MMSRIRVRLVVVTIVMAALPALAFARGRGYGRVGPAMTIYGPVYNPTATPEYRLWASNPAAYEQMMMMRQQQFLMKQQQAYMKQMKVQQQQFGKWVKTQKSRKDKGLPTDPMYDQYLRMQEAAGPAFLPNENDRRNADPTVAPGGGPRPPSARRATSKKAAPKKAASKKAATKPAEE
jgi:hypothetical protein